MVLDFFSGILLGVNVIVTGGLRRVNKRHVFNASKNICWRNVRHHLSNVRDHKIIGCYRTKL